MVDLPTARCPVTKTDDVGAALPQARSKGKSLGMPCERNESFLAIAVVPHQDGEFTIRFQGLGGVTDELTIATKEVVERGSTREVAGVVEV